MAYAAGVDVGSTQTKAVIIDEQRQIISRSLVDTGANVIQAAENAYQEVLRQGELSEEEYDRAIADLVNYMEYVGEPTKLEAHALGYKVMIFLLIFFVLAYLLKKEYWKDVH